LAEEKALKMNKASVSLETLSKIEDMELDKSMERVLKEHEFDGGDLSYKEIDGERRLVISQKAVAYILSHKGTMRRELEKAKESAAIKAIEAGLAIIEMQKMGGAV
jgi:hypothetical protein